MCSSSILALIALSAFPGQEPKANPFESEIAAFEAQDRIRPPKPGGVLFIGSSSIRLWKSVEQDFPSYPVLNRGFGGSQISDSITFVKRIVTPYKPKVIVFFAGTNDIASGKSATKVSNDFQRFVADVRRDVPKAKFAYIAITPAPSRWDKLPVIQRANAMIREYCESEPGVRFVNTYPRMLNRDGSPRKELYLEDQLHLKPESYRIWVKELAPVLRDLWRSR